jgi:hypothetical protein
MPKRAKYAFVASKATKSAYLRSEARAGSYRLVTARIGLNFFHFPFSIFHFFVSASRDANHPSHGTGQNPKNINKHGPWDGGTGPEGVGRGASACVSKEFKAIQRNSNQNKNLLSAIAPNCSQLHLIAPRFYLSDARIRTYSRLIAVNRTKKRIPLDNPCSICVQSVAKPRRAAVNGTNRQQTAPQFKKFYVFYRRQCIKLVRFAMFAIESHLMGAWNLVLLWSLEFGTWSFR